MALSVYSIVDLGQRPEHTRILTLNPGTMDEPLTGSVAVISLENLESQPSLNYIALSYCWGEATPEDATIQLQADCQPVAVRRNLKLALMALRSPDQPVRLWADAICLDQSNILEKEFYVPLMNRVYSHAVRTVIWLGEADADSDLAMATLRQFHQYWWDSGKKLTIEWLEENITRAQWRALAALLRRSWFTRVWIVQEALLSKATMLQCGSETASIQALVLLQERRMSRARSDRGLELIPAFPFSLMLINWERNLHDARKGCPLYEWIISVDRFQCGIPRDRFYAMLNMSLDDDGAAIPVNYDESALTDAMICTIATKHFLKQFKCLLPLQSGYKKNLCLPSWCPDWFTDTMGYVSLVVPKTAGSGDQLLQYNACGPYTHWQYNYKRPEPSEEEVAASLILHDRLCLRGWYVDTVEYTEPFAGPSVDLHTSQEEKLAGRRPRREALYEQSKHWKGLIDEMQTRGTDLYRPRGTLHSAFWRTLITNRTYGWYGPPEDDFGQRLEAFWERGPGAEPDSETSPFLIPAIERLTRRSFIITKAGLLGLAPAETRKGDLVCVLFGGRVPFILRKNEALGNTTIAVHRQLSDAATQQDMELTGKSQLWIGEAYIHGIMQGEYIQLLKSAGKEAAQLLDFEIV